MTQDLISLITDAAQRHGLDPAAFLAQIRQESNLDPNAVSKAGAIGLGQLMPGTAKALGVANPRDPTQNIEGAATYMEQLTKMYGGDQAKALAAYNWGPGNMARAGGDLSQAPQETRDYVAKLTSGQVPATSFNSIFPQQKPDLSWVPPTSAPQGASPQNPLLSPSFLLAGLAPTHKAVQVDYDPWALVPHLA